MNNKKELSVYVHIPYCQRKCKYCDFISFENEYNTVNKYINSIVSEIGQYDLSDYTVNTIFFGGGTPSSIPSDGIEKILSALRTKCAVSDDAEITVECNPCSLNYEKALSYYKNGVNRISIGVQSFDDNILQTLGRLHNSKTAVNCIENVKMIGFSNISVDLMFSIPGQSIECLRKSIEKCMSLDVEHISLYSLIVEDGTEISRLIENSILSRIDDDTDRLMYLSAKTMLEENGYMQYEVSNFAKRGFESKHNTAYWERKEYIGLGCAAHSFFNGIRYSNTKNLYEYINGICVKDVMAKGECIYGVSEAEEIIMLGLRMNKGLCMSDFYINTGFSITEKCGDILCRLDKDGLIELSEDRISVTDKGRDVLNYVILEIVSEF